MTYDELKRALKCSINEDKFELFTSPRSLPLKSVPEKRIIIKVLDHSVEYGAGGDNDGGTIYGTY